MTDINITKRIHRNRRHARVRAKISGTAQRPRVTVFKSNVHVYVQAVDDVSGKTLAAVNDAAIKKVSAKGDMTAKIARAFAAGQKLAAALKEQKISTVVFDAAGFTYHGRIKAVADALRKEGITV